MRCEKTWQPAPAADTMRFLKIILLFFLGASMAGCGILPFTGKAPVTSPGKKSLQEIDTACSYFYFLWGRNAENTGAMDEAREAYEKALICQEDSLLIRERLLAVLIQLDKLQDALDQVEYLLDRHPGRTGTMLLAAQLYIEQEEFDKAFLIYEKLLAQDPDNENVLLLQASLYGKLRKYEEVTRILEKIIAMDPESFLGHYYLAALYRTLNWHKRAIAAYTRVLELRWSEKPAMELASLYVELERFRDAAVLYRKILATHPDNDTVRARLANVYLKMQDLERAQTELERLRTSSLDRRKIDLAIGRILISRKQYDQAVELLQPLARAGEDGTGDARLLIAIAFLQKGDTEAAKKYLAGMDPEDKEYEKSILGLVQILREQNEIGQAISLLRARILEKNGARESFFPALAVLYSQDNRKKEAEATFQEGMRRFPAASVIVLEYGLFLERDGRRDQAFTVMKRALAMDPDNPSALNYVGYTMAEKGEELEQALAFVQKAVAALPEDGFVRDSLGWVYFKMGHFDDAVRELQKALALITDDPVIYEHLGDALQETGAGDRARDAYDKAIEFYDTPEHKERVRQKRDSLSR